MNLEHYLSNTDLRRIIWNPPKFRALGIKTASLTRNTFKYWDLVHTQNKWTHNSPLIYMKDNFFFEPGRREVGGNWLKDEGIQLKNVLNNGRLRTYDDLRVDPGLRAIDGWRYLQLSHSQSKNYRVC